MASRCIPPSKIYIMYAEEKISVHDALNKINISLRMKIVKFQFEKRARSLLQNPVFPTRPSFVLVTHSH